MLINILVSMLYLLGVNRVIDFSQVIASRGDNIIAVANPALMECNHPIKKEPEDEKSTL